MLAILVSHNISLTRPGRLSACPYSPQPVTPPQGLVPCNAWLNHVDIQFVSHGHHIDTTPSLHVCNKPTRLKQAYTFESHLGVKTEITKVKRQFLAKVVLHDVGLESGSGLCMGTYHCNGYHPPQLKYQAGVPRGCPHDNVALNPNPNLNPMTIPVTKTVTIPLL